MTAQVARMGILGIVLTAVLAVFASGSAARPTGKANLVVTKVTSPPKALTQGSRFTVRDTTKNRGKRTAGATTTRYYLTKNPAQSLHDRLVSTTNPRTSPTDILLVGDRAVKRLRRGKSSKGKAVVTVPGGTPAGRYFLLACSDDRGVVAESKETDNCKTSAQTQTIAPPSGSAGRIDSFSDLRLPLDPSEVPYVRQLLQIACANPTKPQKMSLKHAISSAKSYLTQTAGPGAMAAFKASADYNNVSKLESAAGGAVLSSSPGASLAALLRAHELQPKEAIHLENAAGVASAIGLPNEAIAFLDAAVRLDEPKRLPMGISRQAAALTTRGYAQLEIGKFADAERSLQAAIALSPLLSEEASTTLAAARECQGKDPIAAYKVGRYRQNPPPQLDDSQGKVTELRHFPFPALPENAFANATFYQQLDATEAQRFNANVEKTAKLEDQLNQELATKPALTQEATHELISRAYLVSQDSDLKSLENTLETNITKANNAIDALFGQDGKYLKFQQDSLTACANDPDPEACFIREMRSRCIPAAKLTHQEWLNDATAAYAAAQQYQRVSSKRISAIASHLESQNAYSLLLATIEGDDLAMYALFSQTAMYWSGDLARAVNANGTPYCVDSPEPEKTVDPGDPKGEGSGPCPPELKDFSASVEVGGAELEGNCEEVSVSVSSEGWIGAFAQVTYNYREGSVSFFAGSKGEVGFGPLSGDFKSGIYVEAGREGFKDVGWRVGPSYTVGAGPAHFGGSDYENMSFIGAFGGLRL